MRHILPISGKDSLATAIVQVNMQPDLDYEFMFNPTGLELPDVFEWIDSVGDYFGKPVIKVGKDLHKIIQDRSYFLPSPRARYCTQESKIFPFIDWINKENCMVYYGIRADEQREGFNNTLSPNIIPKYPLKDLGINLEGVYIIVNKVGLKPPTFFWEEIYERVKKSLVFDPKERLTEWHFDMLFAWRSRTNCDRCFNQRLYEWVGLLEHYPDRYWEAEEWEHKGSENIYTWNGNKSLKEISEQKEEIKRNRIKTISKFLFKQMQGKLFDEESFIDVLAIKSCGLFCGK
jgi:hypothetical protein